MAITSQEQFEKLRANLKAGAYANDPELQDELIAAAQAWKANNPQGSATPEPAQPQGGSIADPLGQGALFGFSDELAGLAGAAFGTFDPNLEGTTFGERYRGIRDAARENLGAFRERNPGTALAAEIAGGVTTGGVGAVRSGAVNAAKSATSTLQRLRPVAATGAIQGGLFGAGTAEGDLRDRATGAAQGAAIGGATAPILPLLAGGARNAANRVFQTQSNNPVYQRAVRLLEDKTGIRTLTTGQRTGSSQIRAAETTAAETLTGARLGRQLDENRRLLQARLMRMAGFTRQDASNGLVTVETIDNAASRFSKQYQRTLGNAAVRLDTEDFVEAIADVQARNSRALPFQQKRQIAEIVDQIFDDATDGAIDPNRYQRIRSDLGKLERSHADKPVFAKLYRDLKHAIDDAMFEGIGRVRKSALDRQYNRFTKLRDTFEGSGAIGTARGELPLASLLRRAAKRGKGADKDFTELVRAGQIVLGDPTPNSATASRLINAAILGEGTAAMTGIIDPTAGLAALAVPFGANQALSRGFTGNAATNRLIGAGFGVVPAAAPLGLLNQE